MITRSRLGGHAAAGRLALRIFIVAVTTLVFSSFAEAKTPGKTYCFNGICHYVKTLAETQRMVGKRITLKASHYDSCRKDRYNPCGLTSSGEEFRPWAADNAASPHFPNGTRLLVWHPGTKKAVVVRINNAGPYHGSRNLDLSRAAAEKLGFAHSGVASVQAKVIAAPTQSEATYSRGRRYASVAGYIGRYDSFEMASASATGGSSGKSTAVASNTSGKSSTRAVGMGRGTSSGKQSWPKGKAAN